MSIVYQLAVVEDLELGHGTVQRSLPGGGTGTGTKISLSSFAESTGELFSALPTAAVGKGQLRWVRDSTTTTIAATVTGGGSGYVLCASNGTNWKVVFA